MVASRFPGTNRFRFEFSRANYVVPPGGRVSVTVYLIETFEPKTSSPLLATGGDGLVSAGLVVDTSLPGPVRPAKVCSASAIAGNPKFDFAIIPQFPTPTLENGAGIIALSSTPVFGKVDRQQPRLATASIAIGTFLFTAGPILGDVTYLVARNLELDPRLSGDFTVTSSGVVLDRLVDEATATITVLADCRTEPGGEATPGLHNRFRSWRRGGV